MENPKQPNRLPANQPEKNRKKAIEQPPKDKQYRPDKAGDNYRTKAF
ncbi:MAG: hypothetical protein ACYTEQ_31220 [Planctomycetota bacterium]|jgi:hypothetical protein